MNDSEDWGETFSPLKHLLGPEMISLDREFHTRSSRPHPIYGSYFEKRKNSKKKSFFFFRSSYTYIGNGKRWRESFSLSDRTLLIKVISFDPELNSPSSRPHSIYRSYFEKKIRKKNLFLFQMMYIYDPF
jgi:hypothetical protein